MFRWTLIIFIFLAGVTHASALNMNVQTDEKEKFAYVNLWGPIEIGDGEK